MATDVRALPHDRPTAVSVPADRSPVRDPFLDNAKFLAIVLVVIGHAIEPLRDVPATKGLYVTIYAFHMPVFILISGYLSRNFTGKPHQGRRLITGIVLPYLIFEFSYEILRDFTSGTEIVISPLDPSFAMWFLIALLFWRLSVPMWNALHPVVAVAVAVAISLAAGLTELPSSFDPSRVLGFLPFYVAGLMMPKRYFDLVRTKLARGLAIPALLFSLAGAYLFAQDGGRVWLYYDKSYEQIGVSALSGLGHRACALALGFVLLTAFLAVVPRRFTWFTGLGAATMYVYLLHRFVVKGAAGFGLYEPAWLHTVAGSALVVALAVGLVFLFSSRPVTQLVQPFAEPRLDWLFRLRSAADRR
ncbi:MAG: acyltransferase family protein [Streptosporangiales bacterium]|nr:acyltransferase family protein [Streptosporangiales bacterium]